MQFFHSCFHSAAAHGTSVPEPDVMSDERESAHGAVSRWEIISFSNREIISTQRQ
jgi:hypothetical protein